MCTTPSQGKDGEEKGVWVSYCIVRTILHRLQYRWKAQKMTQGVKRKWASTKNDYVRSICIQKGITHKQPGQMKKLPQDLSFFLCMLISLSLSPLSPLSCCRKDNFLQFLLANHPLLLHCCSKGCGGGGLTVNRAASWLWGPRYDSCYYQIFFHENHPIWNSSVSPDSEKEIKREVWNTPTVMPVVITGLNKH